MRRAAKLLRPSLTIAAYTLLEALRNRLLWVLAVVLLGAIAVSGFLNELALTESRQLQAALLAAVLRLAAVFLIIAFVVTSMVREANDKGVELLLAMALPRAAYLFGKLAGFGALAVLPAFLFGALMLLFAPPPQAALWSVSLLCELWIVAAFSVLCTLTMNQVLPALAAAFSFYLLARTAGAMQLLASAPSQPWLNAGVDALAALLPHFDRFTRTEWLIYHTASWQSLLDITAQTAIYVALMVAAALFDLYRKNF